MTSEGAYSEDQLRRAVENCSSNPIHIPETIQGFGAMVACDLKLTTILRVSANAKEVLGQEAEALLGASPDIVLTQQELHEARNRLGHATIEAQREMLISRPFGETELQVSLHKRDGKAIFEFIPELQPAEERVRLFEQARAFLTLPLESDDLDSFLAEATERIRAMVGYDRVKFYRFLPDNSGEVTAEARHPDMPSFLGLRFPETDIPPIARQLYVKTPMRVLHDINAPDIPILGEEGAAPLDMSLAVLRGLDLVHRQYLKNMDVGGTFSISVVVDGALWGLFACHNHLAKPVDPSVLMAAELAGKLISLRIQHHVEAKRQIKRRRCSQLASKFVVVDDSALAVETYWQNTQKELFELVACDGVALMTGQRISTFGDVPPETALHALFSLVGGPEEQPLTTDDLRARLPGAEWQATGGAMAIAFGRAPSVKIAFLRNLAENTVSWAGSPEKDIVEDAGGIRLDPRNSFETYLQNVEGRSTEWSADDIETGRALLQAFAEAQAVQQELASNRHRLGLMVRELNHRVRNILALVQSISVYSRENATSITGYAESLEKRIIALAGAHNLLTRADMEGALLNDIFAFELGPFMGDETRIEIDGPSIALRPDAVSVLALLSHELTSNAAKYGALSTADGQVSISWQPVRQGVQLDWVERGGPAVREPERSGFGRSIIEDAIPYEFGGEANLQFEPSGVTARFWLPGEAMIDADLASSVGAQPEPSAMPDRVTKNALTGLVVEDNFIVSKRSAKMLQEEGFSQVDRAASVSEAQALLKEKSYDLCLLDVNLQGEWSTPIAHHLLDSGTPFIFTTGYGSDGNDVIDEFDVPSLTKPVEPKDLQRLVRRLLKDP